jgi:ribonucleoside-diphosphate reductase alpha chain
MYWLNENSKKFLSKGYLMEGVTAEERIREIAKKAENYLNKPGFADKFYDYMSKGFYSLASPVWSNYGLKRGATSQTICLAYFILTQKWG